jgi:excinuclease ABC subunit B
MYADTMTDSMKQAIDETNRRRKIQADYNKAHGIEPRGIVKQVKDLTDRVRAAAEARGEYKTAAPLEIPKSEAHRLLTDLEKQMKEAAGKWEFEKAALLRDQILELRAMLDSQDTRPEWKKIMEDEDHEELAQLREQRAERLNRPGQAKSPAGKSR